MRLLDRRNTPYLYIAPTVILICVFIFFPMGKVFYLSLRNYELFKPYKNGFIGIDNFIFMFTKDPEFLRSLSVTLKWVVSQVVFQLCIGLVCALILNTKFKLRNFGRIIIFIPWAVSGVLTSMIWDLLYDYRIGPFNDLLVRIGIIAKPIAWLSNSHTAFFSAVIAQAWIGIPFFCIMFLSALQTIPTELYESAHADGANSWRCFTLITLPYLKYTIVFTSLLRAVWEFNFIDIIYNLTSGGPGHDTTTLSYLIVRQATLNSDYGYGAALSVFAFLILIIFAFFYLKITGLLGKGDNE